MIIRYGKFVTMMKHQEKDEEQKSMEKEQWAMSSTPTGEDLLLIQHVFYLHHLLQSSITQNLVVASKVSTLATHSMIFFWIIYSIYTCCSYCSNFVLS